ncbi:MAG: phosphate acyltransferase PlsX [Clostridia bacterium]|nr:phosphate acyltransferase PlsX [Clostridia bacterium]
MKIAVDAFGGDNAPFAVIEGCVKALKLYDGFEVILYGAESEILAELEKYEYDKSRVKTVNCTEIITCDEAPTVAVKRKKDSSMVRALEDVANGKADCIISAGSTGALLTGATLIIKRIKGIKRPALGTFLPNHNDGSVMLIDCGANTDCKPAYLLQFAVMADAYLKGVYNIKAPRIGLLNNGAESEKGNELTKATYKLLEESSLNFVGNIEARDILTDKCDVLVCDGFDGNIVLKHTEGLAHVMMSMLKKELMSKKTSKIGAALSKRAFRNFKRKLDYSEYGGAPLLGVNKTVIKAHGSSDAKAFASAINQAIKIFEGNVNHIIEQGIDDMVITGD